MVNKRGRPSASKVPRERHHLGISIQVGALDKLIKFYSAKSKSEAIRMAIHEVLNIVEEKNVVVDSNRYREKNKKCGWLLTLLSRSLSTAKRIFHNCILNLFNTVNINKVQHKFNWHLYWITIVAKFFYHIVKSIGQSRG